MPKIAFIGAGSTVFAKNLLGDILSYPDLAESTISLFDIDAARLAESEGMAHAVATALEAHPSFQVTTDRRAALDGADYAICMIQVGGYRPATRTDFEIPKRYGLRQTIADTLGIGGIMRGLRTVPVLVEMAHEMEELCPEVVFLNYVNPMAINTWALNRASRVKTVGLCHSVQGTAQELSHDLGIPFADIDYLCAGINHMAFYLRLERKTPTGSVALYPELRRLIEEGRVPAHNRVRYEVFRHLDYFVTESSEHFAEYTPWFIKRDRPDLITRFNIPLDEYPRRCEDQITRWDKMRSLLSDARTTLRVEKSGEYCAGIIHSLETGMPRQINGNVMNNGLIDNLPSDCVVEVPCRVDDRGIQPLPVGRIPIHLAALMQTNINVQALTVEAALTGNRQSVYHAAMLDPHTAAELDLDQIHSMVDELIDEHKDWLPQFRDALELA
jgi:alpha-galactosidase